MRPQRVQMGRNGPQFTFAEHNGTVYVLDHGIGDPVCRAEKKVCAFIWEYLPKLPDDGRIVYRSDIGWDQLRVRNRQYAGPAKEQPSIDLDEARRALDLSDEGHESPAARCAS